MYIIFNRQLTCSAKKLYVTGKIEKINGETGIIKQGVYVGTLCHVGFLNRELLTYCFRDRVSQYAYIRRAPLYSRYVIISRTADLLFTRAPTVLGIRGCAYSV